MTESATRTKDVTQYGEGGRPLASEQPRRAIDLAGSIGPQVGIERLDAYAKWIFISAGVIAVLGAGLSAAVTSTLSDLGRVVLGTALAAVGLSVASSALSLASLVDSTMRRRFLVIACVSFGIALFLGGIAPLASAVRLSQSDEGSHNHSLTYNLDAVAGSFQATLSGNDFAPGSSVELRLAGTPRDRDKNIMFPRGRAVADANGVAKITATLPHVDMLRELVIFTRVMKATGETKDDTITFDPGKL